jgi:hydroxymethylbilane synthase
MVRDALCRAHGWPDHQVEIVPIRTTGDRIQTVALAELGGKALWTKELDRALAAGEIDFAVHSMKDVETLRPSTISIAAMLPRADVRDRLIGAEGFAALPPGARVGTSSPRRSAQILRLRGDLRPVLFRGNVDTRLKRLADGEAEATLLAAAGLDRLGRAIGTPIEPEVMLPAPAQGAVGIETLTAAVQVAELVNAIGDPETLRAVAAERALLAALGADCRSPVAALAEAEGETLRLRAELICPDGAETVFGEITAGWVDAARAAATLAADLLGRAGPSLRALFTGPAH